MIFLFILLWVLMHPIILLLFGWQSLIDLFYWLKKVADWDNRYENR